MTVVKFPEAREILDLDTRRELWNALMEDTRFSLNTFRDFRPEADVVETNEHYEVRLALAGVTKDNIKVELEGNRLTVRGERPADDDASRKYYRRREITNGGFARSFLFPEKLDPTQVSASFRNGILSVKLPKTVQEELSQRIEVK